MLFLLSSSSSSLLLLSLSSYYYYYYCYYYYYHYYYYYYYSVNNIPYQCDINCAGHFTLDALASRTVACLCCLIQPRPRGEEGNCSYLHPLSHRVILNREICHFVASVMMSAPGKRMLVPRDFVYNAQLNRKIEKRREFLPRLQEKSSSARLFLQPSVAF